MTVWVRVRHRTWYYARTYLQGNCSPARTPLKKERNDDLPTAEIKSDHSPKTQRGNLQFVFSVTALQRAAKYKLLIIWWFASHNGVLRIRRLDSCQPKRGRGKDDKGAENELLWYNDTTGKYCLLSVFNLVSRRNCRNRAESHYAVGVNFLQSYLEVTI